MRKRNWLGLLAVIALLVIALPGCMPGEEEANAQSAAINDVRAKADSNAGQISGLTGRVGALEARATGEVSAASFAALQAQVNGLQTTIGAQEARIAELEAADTDSGSNPTGDDDSFVGVTRWRSGFDFSCDKLAVTLSDYADPLGTAILIHKEYEPRTIKEADIYTFTFEFLNLSGATPSASPAGTFPAGTITLCNLVCSITLTPTDKVEVSDTSAAYDIAGPADIWWETNIATSASTGACRRIELETEPFNLTIADGATETIELEFELIYS